jgi:hypothetical protein
VSEAKPSPAAHVNCISNSQAWNPTRAQILVADHNIEASPGTPPFQFVTVRILVELGQQTKAAASDRMTEQIEIVRLH